ncbi:sulfatase-like hydrolase/transferase [Microlunatus speluncae]|uniref:sulfatase-like hydrolase/transferase n=1 Tax=Microlunatus speluncae TaxID=2594267 RepID=UPI00126661D6|nr:sulfatase-like hydrolase/transferase [Microlunatus speluncae]
MVNVVLFMSDEHNPKYSSTYGHPFVATPNLDRLAAQGTVYESAYCPSPLCVPSRSAFMTGRWVHEIQRYNNCKIIEGRFPTYGGVLAEQGVHTVYLGSAANLYRDPHALGFSELRLVNVTRRSLNPASIRGPVSRPAAPRTTAESGPRPDRFAEDVGFVDHAVDWLTGTAPGLGRPWTITVNVHPPHPPYTADPAGWSRYRDHGDLPHHGADHPAAQHPYTQDLRDHGGRDYPDQLVRELRVGYYAAVSYVDAELGRVIDAVERAGLADDTVIMYTTDHGEMLGRYGLWGKCSLAEDSVRIPIVAAGPGFAAGARVRTPVTLLDLQSSLFHAVGADRPAGWRGSPLQLVAPDDHERVAFAEYHGPGVRGGGFLIRRGRWKLLHHCAAPHQLFDLAADPDELHDLWDTRPDIVDELEAELHAICDPVVVDRDAEQFQRRQHATIDSLRASLPADTREVAWS